MFLWSLSHPYQRSPPAWPASVLCLLSGPVGRTSSACRCVLQELEDFGSSLSSSGSRESEQVWHWDAGVCSWGFPGWAERLQGVGGSSSQVLTLDLDPFVCVTDPCPV